MKKCERCETPIEDDEGDLCEYCTDEGYKSTSEHDAIYESIREGGIENSKE